MCVCVCVCVCVRACDLCYSLQSLTSPPIPALGQQVSELQEKHEECTAVIQDAQSEIQTLHGQTFPPSLGSDAGSTPSSVAEVHAYA